MATSRGETQVATASYIETMLAELRSMSEKMDAEFLSYLLEMAVDEAARLTSNPPKGVSHSLQPVDAAELAKLYMAGKLD